MSGEGSSRIAMVNIGVGELRTSRRFYEEVFGIEFTEESHADRATHLNASFGTWGTDSFFLIQLWPNSDRAGTADVGFLVPDVDEAYRRALESGGSDVNGPRDMKGMPRRPTTDEGQQVMDAILFHPETSQRRALILALGSYGTDRFAASNSHQSGTDQTNRTANALGLRLSNDVPVRRCVRPPTTRM
jgi:predicted enzyme related to lactoylglutathione lyase